MLGLLGQGRGRGLQAKICHKFGSVVVVLLKMAPFLVCQNNLDGMLVTKKVADCAVRAHMGHASADHVGNLGK